MIARPRPQRGLRWRCCAQPSNRRNLAAAASGTFQYRTGEAAGVKVASRDLAGPTTTLGLVARAGTRYQWYPGFTEGLETFAFKSTQKRSSLRIIREVELLGGELKATHSRENLVLGAKFMREDLPYFVELLGEVATQTRYTAHEFHEEVLPTMKFSQKGLLASTKALATNSAHGVAFHRGLGNPLHPTSSTPLTKYLTEDYIAAYADVVYSKPNFAIVANGVGQEELSKWVSEFFADASSTVPKDAPALESVPTKYYGGEERIAHDSGNTIIIAFPGTSSYTAGGSYKPEVAVLAALLGGESSIKWSPGFSLFAKAAAAHPGAKISTTHAAYSDAGLLSITFSGKAGAVRGASEEAVKALKSVAAGNVSADDLKKATALAKFQALEAGQAIDAGLESTGAGLIHGGQAYQIDEVGKSIDAVKPDQVKKVYCVPESNAEVRLEANFRQIAKQWLDGKATVTAVGDLFVLPFAEELGLNV
ncbi:MAG: ubiquinol-cytochrome c reductase core subunit 1 [Piccolia ochrophora]|nr:MAG: ubiquinol-cytochrome c reductase core subunit 1 [Piccolia ochrophora]